MLPSISRRSDEAKFTFPPPFMIAPPFSAVLRLQRAKHEMHVDQDHATVMGPESRGIIGRTTPGENSSHSLFCHTVAERKRSQPVSCGGATHFCLRYRGQDVIESNPGSLRRRNLHQPHAPENRPILKVDDGIAVGPDASSPGVRAAIVCLSLGCHAHHARAKENSG